MKKLYRVIAIIIFYTTTVSSAQDIADEYVLKAAFVGQFVTYIDWPENDKKITIGYLGSNTNYWNSLNEMSSLRNLHITKIDKINMLSNINMHVLIVDKFFNKDILEIHKLIKNKPILVITEEISEDNLIGIDFFKKNKEHLSFRLNRYNLVYRKLGVRSDIVLLGGFEIDIANMVNEMSGELHSSYSYIKELQSSIDNQKGLIDKNNRIIVELQNKISSRNRELEDLTKRIATNKSEFDIAKKELASQLEHSSKLLIEKQSDISKYQSQVESFKEEAKQLSEKITSDKETIVEQKKILSNLEEQLKTSKVSIAEKERKVKKTYNILYISLAFLFLLLIFLFIILKISKRKQQLNSLLEKNNLELIHINEELTITKNKLVESEKIAALGGLVAGVAHEVNTPLGAAITAVSHLSSINLELKRKYEEKTLSSRGFFELLHAQIESTECVFRNLCRSAELVNNFKQVSVDEVSEVAREFELVEYLKGVLNNLKNEIKNRKVNIEISSEFEIHVFNYPGVLSQIINNLIINSLIHGFKSKEGGNIRLVLNVKDGNVMISYFDDGLGIDDKNVNKIFEPFFTTNRSSGSTGLGLSICYNLIAQKMHGSISCIKCQHGAHFEISFPASLKVSSDELMQNSLNATSTDD